MMRNAATVLRNDVPEPFVAKLFITAPQAKPAAACGRARHLLVAIRSREPTNLPIENARPRRAEAEVAATVARWLARYAPFQAIPWPTVSAAVTSCD
jgi:hypothetical protein